MPYVQLSNEYKVQLYRQLEKNKPITVSYRSWEFYEYPSLPATNSHVWTVKTSTQLEKPRYIVISFQTNRKNVRNRNASRFDHCGLVNLKVFLNSQYYPYSNMNLDITQNQYAILYDMYANFQHSYYGKDNEPVLNRGDFIELIPLIVIDCSKQNDTLKNAPVDVLIEMNTSIPFPPQTAALCLIIHDRYNTTMFEYNAISGEVRKIV